VIRGSEIDHAVEALCESTSGLDRARALLSAEAGLYGWWAPTDVLADLPGPAHPHEPGMRMLYLGIATDLRRRVRSNHLRRSGTSTLRRTLAGLLLEPESLRTTWTDRVVLVDEDEVRLTAWMDEHLRLTWCAAAEPRRSEAALIERLRPPLNVEHASGPHVDAVTAARARYYASAGPRPATRTGGRSG
jgi:hypothetical protein